MTDDPKTADDSVSHAQRIDHLCDAFESAWNSDQRPKLEDSLAQASPTEQEQLLRELLPVEIFHRVKCGEQPRTNDYAARFPGLDAVWIEQVIAQHASSRTVAFQAAFRPGAIISGRYVLKQKLGEGGMGEVWVAKQIEPVKRNVALKLIKTGTDSREVLARFEAERQAFALMDHPNIARVLDGGITSSGQPFFVMELVNGLPLNKFCDEAKLTLQQRLELFVPICQAVQHAHHKGIVHRDLKPSNILVTLIDGRPVPKVIDFGVAKATAGKLTDESLETQFGAVVGTLEYMSPEQAGYSGADIDTRADIYSLGVILYELLTGLRPIDAKRLKQAAYTEMIRIIKEEEPSKPSTRLSTDESLPSLAALRQTEPRKLMAILRGELDWVVMKCLEKDRTRRYETANGLARDIERYLNHEPVEAGPPSAVYRLKKLARKHRSLLVTFATFAALLVLGTTVSTWQAIRATTANGVARASEQKARLAEEAQRIAKEQALAAAAAELNARQAAQAATAAESKAKESALQREAETRAVLDFIENNIFAAAIREGQHAGPRRDITLQRALQTALPFVHQNFANQPLIEAGLRITLGRAFLYLGEAQIASEQYQTAHSLYMKYLGPDHPDTLRSVIGMANSYSALGKHADALKLREETIPLLKDKLGPDHWDTLLGMDNLARSYSVFNRHGEALKLFEETLALRRAKLGPDHMDTINTMHNLANSYATIGRHAEALGLREETLAAYKAKLGPTHQSTLWNMISLAESYTALGRIPDALRLRQEGLALRTAKLGPDHADTLNTMGLVADSLAKLDRGTEALPIIDECLKLAASKEVRGPLIWNMINLRFRHFEKTQDVAGCRATAEIREKQGRTDAVGLYNAAWMRAATAAVIRATDQSEAATKDAAAEADRAMDWLRKSVAAGGFNNIAGALAKDKGFDALRGREDFQELFAALAAGRTMNP